MKISNWCRTFKATLVAAGMLAPSALYAGTIPLGDSNFENYTLPASGFAYADTYRPTSAWVDDLDSPAGYTQDDAKSNWLYSSAYANTGPTFRAQPRSGDQAMHGLGDYSAQKTSAVFEAGKTYTFSLWAQGDSDAGDASSRVFLYVFDGASPFSEAGSLIHKRFAPDTGDFVNRGAADAVQSLALWKQISLSYTVAPGAPEIGHPVGVAFWGAEDAAVDDAALSSKGVPEPASIILVGIGGVSLAMYRRRK